MRTALRRAGDWLAWTIAAIDVALILVLAVQVRDLPIVSNAIDIWFDRSDPTVETERLERRLFGADTWMLATVWMQPARVDDSGDVARALTADLERIAGLTRVISPTSIEVLQRDDQGLFFDHLDSQRRVARAPEQRSSIIPWPETSSFMRSLQEPSRS